MHELAEYVAGHPIWTHEFADKRLWKRLSEVVFVQHPELRAAEPWGYVGPDPSGLGEYLKGYVSRATAIFGATLDIQRGNAVRTEDPIQSLDRIRTGTGTVS